MCMTTSNCDVYDYTVFPDILWSGCLAVCGNTSASCWETVPDQCLIHQTQQECSAAGAACTWCNSRCIGANTSCLPLCGNGIVEVEDGGEACDDGNDRSGDGCVWNCLSIEAGYQCLEPGQPCAPICGDGILVLPEECDDGNNRSGDGCDGCHVEVDWACSNETGKRSVCASTRQSDVVRNSLLSLVGIAVAFVALVAVIGACARRRRSTKEPVNMESLPITQVQVVLHRANRAPNVATFDLTGSTLVKQTEFPFVVHPQVLCFGLGEERAPVDVALLEQVTLKNKSSVPMFFLVCPEESYRCAITAVSERTEPVAPGETATVDVQVVVFCTTKVQTEFSIVASATPLKEPATSNRKHMKLGVQLQSKMSTKLDPEELQVGSVIGDGSFGTVYRGRYKTQDVAIKILKFQDLGDRRRDFEREIRIMEGLRSPYVVGFVGAVTVPGRLCLVTEYVPHGSLGALLGRTKLSSQLKARICLDCAKGMSYLHGSKMMHRDLKPDVRQPIPSTFFPPCPRGHRRTS